MADAATTAAPASPTEQTAVPAPPADVAAPCRSCNQALDSVQRYCLGCGAPVAGVAPPLEPQLTEGAAVPASPARLAVPARRPAGDVRSLAALGAATLAGAMLTLLLVAALGAKTERPISVNVPAAKAPVVNVQGGAAAVAPVVEAPFVADWPGPDGWTVRLQTLPKAGTTAAAVTAAKSAATAKGAKDVGALDSDEFSALAPAQYLVYSGVFRKKAQAGSALKNLAASFPDAKVVRVADADTGAAKPKQATTQDLKDLRTGSGDDVVKKSEKLPDSVGTPGPALPKDTSPKPAADEDDVDTIG